MSCAVSGFQVLDSVVGLHLVSVCVDTTLHRFCFAFVCGAFSGWK